MSRNARLVVSPQARQDIAKFVLYSRSTWGYDQAAMYRADVARAFELIHAHPEIGAARSDLGLHVRTFPVGNHTIVYKLREGVILVIRVVHQRSNLDQALASQ